MDEKIVEAIAPDLVRAQLEKIANSSEFSGGERLRQFLNYVVEQTLEGKAGRIKQYTIALEALGYGVDFNPQSNPSIRVEAQRLRRALDKYYSRDGRNDRVRIDIPKGRYVPVFYDNNVSQIPDETISQPPGSSLKEPESSQPAILVMMFENLNTQDDFPFFARGLTAEILFSLTRFSGLSVLGPLSQSHDNPINYSKLNNEHGAMFGLQGWVRSYGSKIRITTDLTDLKTSVKQWSHSFDFDLLRTSLFEIEDTVSSQIAGVIADGAGIIFKKLLNENYPDHLKHSDVTLAVLRYNNAWQTLAPWDWKSAIEALNEALVAHPKNPLLMALLANSYYADALFEMNLVENSSIKMESLAQEAVSLDPDLQVARYNLVVVNAFLGQPQKCISAAKKAVPLNPNHSRVLGGSAVAVTSVGEYELGLELIQRAMLLNPHYPSWYHFVNYLVSYKNAQYEDAWEEAQKILMKGTFWHPMFRASVLGKLGRIEESAVYLDELLEIKPDFLKRPHDIIKRLFVLGDHVNMIWDGLEKAGIHEKKTAI